MQAVKLVIHGSYWDSQIYQGRLYLFGRDGSVRTVNWDRLIDRFNFEKSLRLAAECAFRRSSYLYGSAWDLFFGDPDVKALIKKKFADLSAIDLEVDPKFLEDCTVGNQNNPFPFPHSDIIIYSKKMFSVGLSGVWQGSCGKKNKYPISTRPKKQWDCPTYSVAAAYGTLALAAGDDGLWEADAGIYNRYEYFNDKAEEPKQIYRHGCDSCEWMYHSVYGSSYTKGGFLAEFDRNQTEAYSRNIERSFSKAVDDKEIFNTEGYSWGTRDKIYLANRSDIFVARYRPFSSEGHIKYIDRFEIGKQQGDFVSGGVATFGTVLEYENAIVVITSNGESITIPGEPVRWRVFPGSRQYQNHLHVVYDDSIVINSFNNDYFVSQDEKIFGSRAITETGVSFRRGPNIDEVAF